VVTPPPPAVAPLAAAPAVPAVVPTLPPTGSGVVLVPQAGVSVTPNVVVAPVGSEVVMIASVVDPRGNGVPRERMEWMIAAGGVGQFISPGTRGAWDPVNLFRGLPNKVNSTYVINSTLTTPFVLNRGTATPGDDFTIGAGQAWVSIGSPVEGATFVTAYAPDVVGWDHRQQTGTIYWLDAQWTFPPPAITPAGSRHPLTTSVARQTDGSPLSGWTVRYEITGGPEAGFAPDGSNVVEVTTDSTGQATAEVFEKSPSPGTNQISIQVIRPAGSPGAAGRAITVGTGSVLQTWTASGISLRTSGPAQAGVGATVTYRIEVSNPGNNVASGVVVTDEVPPGLTYLNSNPAATSGPTGQQWQLGDLQPNDTRSIEVNFRVDRPGSLNYCAAFTGGGGLAGRDCVSTVATAGQLNVSIVGPQSAEVGSRVTYTIDIANQSDATLTHVVVSDRFDPGLEHAVATGAIERDLQDDIPPRQSRQLAVTFQVIQPGQLCQDVTITAEGGLRGEAHTCVTVPDHQVAAPVPPATPPTNPPATVAPELPPATVPPPTEPPSTPAPPATPQSAGSLTVKATGPARQELDGIAEFAITVTNTGAAPLTNVVVANNFETSLEANTASPGWAWRSGALAWTLDSLAPGASKTWRLRCRCVKEAAKACDRVTVTADGGVTAGDETCLEIYTTAATPPPAAAAATGNLTVSIAEQADPIRVGGDTIYQIVVTNGGSAPAQQVVVSVKISEELRLIAIPVSPVTASASFPRQVRFKPVAEIRAGEAITYELQIQADSAGTGKVQVEVTAPGLSQSVSAQASTQILD
jgi:uncharacterized repeat protein (TIGR01451 family)